MDAHHLVEVKKNPNIPEFRAGDTVQVNYKVREGERTRTQPFQGVVIRRVGGKSAAACFTVRRVTRGFGVERTFPLYSPHIDSVLVQRSGRVRRAKLYYLRERSGRAARIKEQTNLPSWLKASNAAAAAAAAVEAEVEEELVEEITAAEADAELDAAEADAPVDEAVEDAPADEAEAVAEDAVEEAVAEEAPADEAEAVADDATAVADAAAAEEAPADEAEAVAEDEPVAEESAEAEAAPAEDAPATEVESPEAAPEEKRP